MHAGGGRNQGTFPKDNVGRKKGSHIAPDDPVPLAQPLVTS